DPAIHIYDTLSNDARWHEKADLILANPPFMTPKGGVTPHTKFRIAATKAEVLFTDYIAEHLSGDGRGGVIVPNGIVATTQNAYVKLRRFLVEDSLVAVVSLPAGVFKPYSGVKTSILLLDKKLARQTKEILFLKITADGFDLGDKRNPIAANHLPEAERIVKGWLKGKLGKAESSSVVWKAVEKHDLISDKHVVLLAERWGNGEADFGESDSAPLGEIVEKVSDTIAPSSMPSGTPCVGLEHVGQGTGTLDGNVPSDPSALKSGKVRFAEGDILYGKLRPNLNKVWLASFAGICSTDFFALRADGERVEPRLLQFLMLSPQFNEQVLSFVRGAQLPRVSYDDLASIEIPLPPLEEQRRIVAEIEGYQKILDGARQILAGYRVDVVPDPDWPVVPLGDVLNYVGSGVTPRGGKSTYLTSGVLFIRSQNVLWGSCDFSDAAYISPKTHAEMSRTAVKQGDVFLNITGASIGRSALYTETREANVNQHVAILRPNDQLLPAFLTRCLISSFMQRNITTAQTGASREALNYQQIKELEIPLPPLAEQRRLVAELDAEVAQMEAVRSLLPRFEAKIQRVLDRVWGNTPEATA
ncbi:MAG: restriction endonuclease subunit S, partial [Verrucomicrobia bacterium]|nr:restriction endonuclease subunit S [Verrucomicrobiota bacterium]